MCPYWTQRWEQTQKLISVFLLHRCNRCRGLLKEKRQKIWVNCLFLCCITRVDFFELVVEKIISIGYSRSDAEMAILSLYRSGCISDDFEKAVEYVKDFLSKKQIVNSSHPVKQDVVDRLRKVVSIPSVFDVLNGLTKWYLKVSPEEVFLCLFYYYIM